MICIVCPLGCQLDVELEYGVVSKVSGNMCSRGKTYAETECTNPKRTLTTTIRIEGGEIPLLPVKTKDPVSKYLLMELMEAINKISVTAPITMGEVIVQDILGTGADLIATRSVNIKQIRKRGYNGSNL